MSDHPNDRATPGTTTRRLLANPSFRRLWFAQFVSQVGDGFCVLTMMLTVTRLTGSTASVATMVFAASLPRLLFGLFAGVFVDRWDRRRTMITADLVRAVLVLGFVAVRRPEHIGFFYAIGFAQSAVGTFFDPARTALMPSIVEPGLLFVANSASRATSLVARGAGYAAAGVLMDRIGTGWPSFVIDALSFAVSALVIATIARCDDEPPPIAAGGVRTTLAQLGAGLHAVASDRALALVAVLVIAISLALGAEAAIAIPFLVNVLHARAVSLGLVRAAEIVGIVVGSALAARTAARLDPRRVMAWAACGLGTMVLAMGAAHSLATVAVCSTGLGACAAPIDAALATLLQTRVPPQLRGRVAGALDTTSTTASLVMMAAAGALSEAFGVRVVFELVGTTVIAAGLFVALRARTPMARVAPHG